MDDFYAAHLVGRAVNATLFAELRAAGLDLDSWFKARCIFCLFGPMAEAKAVGKPFEDVWDDEAAASDYLDIRRAGHWCGMDNEEIGIMIGGGVAIAEKIIVKPKVWGAVLALAEGSSPGP